MKQPKPWLRPTVIALTTVGALTAWRLWRHLRIPVHETELTLDYTTASPHLLDRRVFAGEGAPQFIRDGAGDLFHRRYYADIARSTLDKPGLIAEITGSLNTFVPNDMAVFQKLSGEDDTLAVGDDYFIHITGPWNGPVRVIEVMPTSFSFITLEGHLEAGEIQFRVIDHPDDPAQMRFEIRSWSRSRDRLIDFFYTRLPVVRAAQRQMWIYFCEKAAEVSGGELQGDVHVVTHRVPWRRAQPAGPLTPWQQYAPRLERMRAAKLNFNLDERESFTKVNGWHDDEHSIDLPAEAPGQPVPGGSFEQAKRVLKDYEFPDPGLVAGIFIPDDALDARVMMIRARFLIFTFYFGVRISGIVDEERTDEQKGPAHVWGYSYQTLEGHFEMGEITFQVWKFIDSGEVEFRIHAWSKTGLIRNPFYRLGFALFGRGLQLRFARTALQRMQQIVIDRQTKAASEVEMPEVAPEIKGSAPA